MSELELLRMENRNLKKALKDTLWMSAEYAEKSGIFAPYIVNRAIDTAKRFNIQIKPYYARDALLGSWDPKIGYFRYKEPTVP
jgi:hypothetical protein